MMAAGMMKMGLEMVRMTVLVSGGINMTSDHHQFSQGFLIKAV